MCLDFRFLHPSFIQEPHSLGLLRFIFQNPPERPENAFKGAMREIQMQTIITAKHSSSTAHINTGHV